MYIPEVTITFVDMLDLPPVVEIWTFHNVLKESGLIEDAIWTKMESAARLTLFIHGSKHNKHPFWCNVFRSCFPRLDKEERLQVHMLSTL